MTFLTRTDDTVASNTSVKLGLTQHGRAGMQILGSIQKFAAAELRPRARAAFMANAEAQALSAEHEADKEGKNGARERIAKAREIAETVPMFRLERFLQRWVGEENFNTGIPAIEERRERFESFNTQAVDAVGGTLDLRPVERPKYYEVNWHLEPGGWDGYDLYGPLFAFAVGPHVFSKGGYAAVGVNEDIGQQRVLVTQQFPKKNYRRIFEPGCGGATTFRAIHTVFPEAELVGCDLSPQLLENGHKFAERMGIPVHLKQRDCTDTGEPDESFDGVMTYALHHELPPKVNAELFAEMYRILEPGGDILISDPPPFRAVELFHAVILDWDTKNRDEPFFSAVLHSNIDEQLRDAGFVNVESYTIGTQGQYPWITRATKPEAGEARAAA